LPGIETPLIYDSFLKYESTVCKRINAGHIEDLMLYQFNPKEVAIIRDQKYNFFSLGKCVDVLESWKSVAPRYTLITTQDDGPLVRSGSLVGDVRGPVVTYTNASGKGMCGCVVWGWHRESRMPYPLAIHIRGQNDGRTNAGVHFGLVLALVYQKLSLENVSAEVSNF
jgi:hypothetical protein